MSLELQIIGSNSAAFAHNRHHTSQLLRIQEQYVLIDCGEGTQLLLKKHKIKISKISIIVISHLHGDHYYGLIGLLSTLHLFGRHKDLTLIGPPGLSDVLSLQLRYSETTLNFHIHFVEWQPGKTELVYDNPKFSITTIPLDHRVPCSGYLFREKDKKRRIRKGAIQEKLAPAQIVALKNGHDVKDIHDEVIYRNDLVTLPPLPSYSYAYCSDTRYKEDLVDNVKEVDLLYHESTFANDMADRAHTTYHSTSQEAATIAKKAAVKKLILGHFSTRYKDLAPILTEAQEIFTESYLAIEGTIFTVDDRP